jgi:solute carrier family 25 oxoglutarate transporter 11
MSAEKPKTTGGLSDSYPGWKHIRPFFNGGAAACFATVVIQPIDMVKVRIQLQGEGGAGVKINRNPISVGSAIIKEEGFLSLYRGLSAALLRQMTYGTTRLGLFQTFTKSLTDEKGNLPFYKRIACSMAAGGIGAFVGTPADAALIRMQADQTLPPDQRRGYKNVFDALVRMAREDGLVNGVFAGASPTIIRALSLNVGMLATYEPSKEFFEGSLGKGSLPIVGAGLVSGLCASVFSLPFDFIKTRLQKMKKLPDGTYPYRGFADCALKVIRKEGPMALYNGFLTYYVRIAPHIVITWFTLETLNSWPALK